MTSRTIFLPRFVCLQTTASSTGKSGRPVIVHHVLQQDITRLYNWSLTWQMVFNTKKCHILSISRKRDRPTITYTLGTDKLSVVESCPYLGVTVSSDLRWHHHINTISNKATRILNFIRRNIYGCSPEAKALAYTSLVGRTHLEYASAILDPYTARDIEQTRQSPETSGTLCHKRLSANHISISTHFRITLAISSRNSRKTENLSLDADKTINGLVVIPMDELEHTSECTRQCGPDAFIILQSIVLMPISFLFFRRTVSDWNFFPSSAKINTIWELLQDGPTSSIWRHH